MYVCICHAVTESQIHQAVRDGTTKFTELRSKLGVSSECGLCASCAKQCLKEANRGTGSFPLLQGQ